MTWVAVDSDGTEKIFPSEPYRVADYWTCSMYTFLSGPMLLPKGSIKKLIGRRLTWEDVPVELKEEQQCGLQ